MYFLYIPYHSLYEKRKKRGSEQCTAHSNNIPERQADPGLVESLDPDSV